MPRLDTLQQFRDTHKNCELAYKLLGSSVVVRCAYHAQLVVVPFTDADFRIIPNTRSERTV